MSDKSKSNLELEIKLMKIREKLKETKELKESKENYFTSVIISFFFSVGFALFLFIKKPYAEKGEYWMYASLVFAVLALIALILTIFSYKQMKEATKEVKKLEKEIQRERERNSYKGQNKNAKWLNAFLFNYYLTHFNSHLKSTK